ncbi:aluminum-activated malate transporter 9-like [Dorcoceras hygrometricum]|uniref:Aluminum-activated malate transporter 9-like n=1 Tax=Dorcoceras hygrometricum TaxID=472368 RepID=A0A2Z7AA10_9LAMI|nr:aluminum-activated malate transporter 9-like [Dorcoceras hygrometricum]
MQKAICALSGLVSPYLAKHRITPSAYCVQSPKNSSDNVSLILGIYVTFAEMMSLLLNTSKYWDDVMNSENQLDAFAYQITRAQQHDSQQLTPSQLSSQLKADTSLCSPNSSGELDQLLPDLTNENNSQILQQKQITVQTSYGYSGIISGQISTPYSILDKATQLARIIQISPFQLFNALQLSMHRTSVWVIRTTYILRSGSSGSVFNQFRSRHCPSLHVDVQLITTQSFYSTSSHQGRSYHANISVYPFAQLSSRSKLVPHQQLSSNTEDHE